MANYDFPHKGRQETGRWMYWLVDNFANDMKHLAGLSLPEIHRFVANIPYKSDDLAWRDPWREVVARPAYILKMPKISQIGGIDCKKKAILLGSWAKLNGLPWEWIAMSERPDKEIHHVFPVIGIGDRAINADATYARYSLGQPKPEMTHAERLFR